MLSLCSSRVFSWKQAITLYILETRWRRNGLYWVSWIISSSHACCWCPLGIGIYFRFSGGKQKTTDDYLLAGKDMSILPVAFSLMASFLSAITVIGVKAEMYQYGINMAYMNIGYVIGMILTAYISLPVFFELNASTAYERLEIAPDDNDYDRLYLTSLIIYIKRKPIGYWNSSERSNLRFSFKNMQVSAVLIKRPPNIYQFMLLLFPIELSKNTIANIDYIL
ncbi:Putative sodium-dependent multivitamin transporter [Araneus ventricosus]|uniref:Sodium-dependent multivitamin transporter n=1 Tax=Araneus ventricosus TaxID=182803 RepID=A0A4Y2N4F6_ARAVE|nr:Putative sodium-dependent multivitamin transporter [Araneus ventricosus]